MNLNQDQINTVLEWMDQWEQLKGSVIPIRFKGDFARHIPVEKPPLGLVPKWVRDQERQGEIMEAINRYMEAGKKPPKEWALEFASYCDNN